MRVPLIVVALTLGLAAPSHAATLLVPSAPQPDRPVTVSLKAPDGLAAGARRIRFTIRQQRRDAACVSLASVTVRPNRRRSGARATLRLAKGKRWCGGQGQVEARVLDRRGDVLGSPIVEAITIAFAGDQTLPVKVTVLDGSTVDGSPLSGELSGVIAGRVSLASATTVDNLTGSLGSCAVVAHSALVLMADGVVFGTLHLDCAGSVLLAGRVGDAGLNSVALDSAPGSAAAHLLVKVDLSSFRSTRAERG